MGLYWEAAMLDVRKARHIQRWQTAVFALLLAPGFAHSGDGLRDCIAQARDSAGVAACEKQAQRSLQEDITRLSAAIRTQLNPSDRLIFDQSAAAWQAFLQQETTMLELTLSRRADGLGARLLPGAVTLLYEQRERQLREHLHNLSSRPRIPLKHDR